MTASVTLPAADVATQGRRNRIALGAWYLCCLGAVVAVAGLTKVWNQQFSLAMLLLGVVLVLAVVRPFVGLCAATFFAVLGDGTVTPWYPFWRNFSTVESVLYVQSRLIMSPLDLSLIALLFGWLLQQWAARSWTFPRVRLLRPLLVFTGFVVLGLAHGLARGGSVNVALWEARSLFYIPVVYVLVVGLTRGDRRRLEALWWCVVAAVLVTGVTAMFHILGLSEAQRDQVETVMSHGTAVPINAVFVLVLASWVFRPSSRFARYALPFLALPAVFSYLVSQRRVAMAALFACIVVVAIVMFWTRRRAFFVVVPVAALLALGYLGAFWNSTGALAAPALAAKTIIAPDQLDSRDTMSNIYRDVENANILFTIRTSRVLGVGFGEPFLRPFALPSISPFLLADYLPHNSIMWVWLKTGFGGFVAFLYLVSKTMRRGAEACLRTARTRAQPFAVMAVCYVVSILVFSFGDIGWDAQNMVILGLAIAHLDLLAPARGPDEQAEQQPGAEDAGLPVASHARA